MASYRLARYFGLLGGLLTLVLPGALHAQQKERDLTGRIVDSDSHEAVPYVSIYDAGRNTGTAADRDGKFEITANVGDSLFLTSIGYEGKIWIVTEGTGDVTIEMSVISYQLDSITVHAFPDYQEFKREVVNATPEPKKPAFDLYIPKDYKPPAETRPGPTSAATSVGVGATIRGPVTALYNALSKEGKDKRKLNAFLKQEDRQEMISQKYNLQVVEHVTNLNEADAKEFMKYCTLSDDFILKSTDYELAIAMLNCLESFKAQKAQQDQGVN